MRKAESLLHKPECHFKGMRTVGRAMVWVPEHWVCVADCEMRKVPR